VRDDDQVIVILECGEKKKLQFETKTESIAEREESLKCGPYLWCYYYANFREKKTSINYKQKYLLSEVKPLSMVV
jgi:hypothetical protein